MVYTGLTERLNNLWLRARTALLLHGANPRVLGNDAEYRRYRAAAYEVGCLLAEQNPAFASALLPVLGIDTPALGPGLPLLPSGLFGAVDVDGPGTITVIAQVPNVVFGVTPPAGPGFTPASIAEGARTRTVFPAAADGLYRVNMGTGTVRLTSVLVPVYRSQRAALREDSRAAHYAFRQQVPQPTPAFTARLARLYGAEALAQRGDAAGYARVIASAILVSGAPTPTALFPSDHA